MASSSNSSGFIHRQYGPLPLVNYTICGFRVVKRYTTDMMNNKIHDFLKYANHNFSSKFLWFTAFAQMFLRSGLECLLFSEFVSLPKGGNAISGIG